MSEISRFNYHFVVRICLSKNKLIFFNFVRYQGNVDSIPLPPAEVQDSIPLPAHEGDASFNSMSFDSEVGYGDKVAGSSNLFVDIRVRRWLHY